MTNKVQKRTDYKPFPYEVESLHLAFDLHDNWTTVVSTAHYTLKSGFKAGTGLRLDGREQELVTVRMNGHVAFEDVDYKVDESGMTILNPPEEFTLMVTTKIHPEKNTSLEGLYRESAEPGSTFCTQCEAKGFRKITYYPDRPDVLTKFTVRIEADKEQYPYILSNGNKVDSGDVIDGRHYALWEDPWNKPAYLFALVAGDLALTADTYTTSEGRKVALEVYTDHHNKDKAGFAIESLKKSMKWDEDTFGLAYDLDVYMIVATDSFNMGAMENKGLNVFNSKYVLADPATTTDAGYEGVEAVIAHEYFHNWTGNRVTCRDWFQLTLKEGLTVFRDEEFSSDMQSREVKRIQDAKGLRNHQFQEDAGPMAHPIRPAEVQEQNNFYTSTVYEKGAAVIRMIHTILGAQGFRKGMDLYFKRHDGQAVTCEDFVNAMADANSVDLSQFMSTWYFQEGTPEVDVTWSYNAKKQAFTLTVKQTPAKKGQKPFHMPMVVGLLDENGNDMTLDSADPAFDADKSILHITKKTQKFVFQNVMTEPKVPSLFRNFSAPVKITAPYSKEDLMFLMTHDSDAFNRYDAANRIAVELIQDMVCAEESGATMQVDNGIVDAFRQVLADVSAGSMDKAFAAQMLSLPTMEYVGGMMSTMNIGLLQKARDMVRLEVAKQLKGELLTLYQANNTGAAYQFTPAEVGRRALKNTCLSYLLELGTKEVIGLAMKQFTEAHVSGNMTDVMSALNGLVNCEAAAAESQKALKTFYDSWKDDTEVMDKWLALQSMSSVKGTLKTVQSLLKHPAYNEMKPNKVRSVVGSFCASGAENFHNVDGSGYKFLADFIIKYDKVNPQTASRFVSPFLRWKRVDATRRKLMKQALERIQKSGKLSPDVSELVERGLKK
jgi:aminopeptidase N